jgi:hypothetical protein
MLVTETPPSPAEIAPEHRRDELVAILSAGLVRLIRASEVPTGPPVDAPAALPAEKLSESGENGLELSGETRLSVVAG